MQQRKMDGIKRQQTGPTIRRSELPHIRQKSTSKPFDRLRVFKKKGRKMRAETKTILIKAALLVVLLMLLSGVGVFAWVAKDIPDADSIGNTIIAESTTIYDRKGENVLYEIYGDQQRTYIPLSEIPKHVGQAFIAVEDQQFYSHQGVNFWGLIRCSIQGIIGNACGGSTITQQYVKNTIVGDERTAIRKVKEMLISYLIEKKFDKDEILERYLNAIPFGSTYYGVEAASQGYFGKSVRDINVAEAGILAAMIKKPSFYSPYGNNVDKLLEREKDVVLPLMKDEGYLTEEQYTEARNFTINFKQNISNIKAPHFVFYIKEQLAEMYGESFIQKGGLKVYTTLDLDLQDKAENAIKNHGEELDNAGADNASLVSIDPKTGQILAMVGSRDYFSEDIDGQVNVALRPRQPGSSIKPLVYALAFEEGYTPDTVVIDAFTQFPTELGKPYEPRNYDDKDHGPIKLSKALGGSLNIPAVQMLHLVGMEKMFQFTDKLGYTTLKDRSRFGLSLVLGGGEVKLLEHAHAYTAFANNGVQKKLASILKVEDKNKNILFEWKDEGAKQVLDANAAKVLNNVLSNNENRAWTFGVNNPLVVPGHTVAAKSGTTNKYVDAWLMGYTPSLVAGVWAGNTDNTPMKQGYGGSKVAGIIWNEFMREALKDKADEAFETGTYENVQKPMLDGVALSKQIYEIDSVSGKLATQFTPRQNIIQKEYTTAHSILHYVIPGDPKGPIPSPEQRDSQYAAWEEAVQKWVQANSDNEEIKKLSLDAPPTEYDDVHHEEDIPSISILQPAQYARIYDNSFTVRVEGDTKKAPSYVEFLIDDQKLKMTRVSSFSYHFDVSDTLVLPSGLKNGIHSLKARVYDELGNNNSYEMFIDIVNSNQPEVSLTWDINNDDTIETNSFPYNIGVKLEGEKNTIKQIDFYSVDTVTGQNNFIDYALPVDSIDVLWKEAVRPGSYRIYANITFTDGTILRNSGIKINVKKSEEVKVE